MNFNQAPEEYDLHGNLTTEIINLYGVKLKLILAEKINIDDIVFGDYSHLKTIPNESYELYGLPEDTEGFVSQGSSFSQFGLFGLDNINIFVSRKAIISIIPNLDDTKGFGNIMGSLIVLPSGKLMEITEITREVPGANNMFVYNNIKNVYKLSLKNYDIKLNSEMSTDINNEDSNEYESLESYFEEMIQDVEEVDNKAKDEKIVVQVDSVFDRF